MRRSPKCQEEVSGVPLIPVRVRETTLTSSRSHASNCLGGGSRVQPAADCEPISPRPEKPFKSGTPPCCVCASDDYVYDVYDVYVYDYVCASDDARDLRENHLQSKHLLVVLAQTDDFLFKYRMTLRQIEGPGPVYDLKLVICIRFLIKGPCTIKDAHRQPGRPQMFPYKVKAYCRGTSPSSACAIAKSEGWGGGSRGSFQWALCTPNCSSGPDEANADREGVSRESLYSTAIPALGPISPSTSGIVPTAPLTN